MVWETLTGTLDGKNVNYGAAVDVNLGEGNGRERGAHATLQMLKYRTGDGKQDPNGKSLLTTTIQFPIHFRACNSQKRAVNHSNEKF